MQTLYHHGTFVTMTEKGVTAEAVVEEKGRITFVGDLDKAQLFAPCAQKVDLQGATILPGFIDAHSHFVGAMQYILYADLSSCTSFTEIQAVLKDFITKRSVSPDGMLMGMGYDQNQLKEQCHPDKTVLDEVSTDFPILIVHASNHMAVANSTLLALTGITEKTPDPEGGRYGRVAGSQEPNGYAEEPAAIGVFYKVSQERMIEDLSGIVGEMQDIYLRYGITTVQDGATPKASCDMLAQVADEKLLVLDVVAYPMYGEDIEGMFSQYERFAGNSYQNHLRLGGVKMFLDGSPQGLTAWMTKPYTKGPEGQNDWVAYGTLSDEEAMAFAKKAIDENRQLLCHTNGDAAADQLLRIYKAALSASDNPLKHKLRPVMIHCQTARKDQFEQMAELGMIPSIFSSHIWYWGDVHLKNLGAVRGGRISACGDAVSASLPFTLHTDSPVVPPNLLHAAWCAVNRITKDGVHLDEDQKVGVYEALCAITKHAAYQYGEEVHKGTLEVGKLADLTVLDKNPLIIDPMELRDVGIVSVVKEGQVVYRQAV